MHLCFIDESGTPAKLGKKEPSTFAIGAVVIPEATWHNVRQKLAGLKTSSKYHGEIKWRFFAPNNTDDDNPMKTWSQGQRDEFRTAVFRIITEQRSIRPLGSDGVFGLCPNPDDGVRGGAALRADGTTWSV